MHESSLARTRRRVGLGMFWLGAVGALWMVAPGTPVVFAPRASAEIRAAGLERPLSIRPKGHDFEGALAAHRTRGSGQ